MTEKRPYKQHKRAAAQDATRQRIVEATVELHQELGPRATSIQAIAKRAGVQRLTVYRHFADETAVFLACTTHWLEMHPPPEPEQWTTIDNPMERACTAIAALHRYYEEGRNMLTESYHDVAKVPALQEPMAQFMAYMDKLADDLLKGFGEQRKQPLLHATLRHLMSFAGWLALEQKGVTAEDKLALTRAWLEGALNQGVRDT